MYHKCVLKHFFVESKFCVVELSLTSKWRAGTEKTEQDRGNSCPRSIGALIPLECASEIDMTFVTNADKPGSPQTALLLVTVSLCLLVNSLSHISALFLCLGVNIQVTKLVVCLQQLSVHLDHRMRVVSSQEAYDGNTHPNIKTKLSILASVSS